MPGGAGGAGGTDRNGPGGILDEIRRSRGKRRTGHSSRWISIAALTEFRPLDLEGWILWYDQSSLDCGHGRNATDLSRSYRVRRCSMAPTRGSCERCATCHPSRGPIRRPAICRCGDIPGECRIDRRHRKRGRRFHAPLSETRGIRRWRQPPLSFLLNRAGPDLRKDGRFASS